MRTNLGLKSGNPQTDANRRLTTLENIVQQIPGRPMSVISTDTIGDTYIVQAAHGFSVGTVINWDGTSWGNAQGNTAANGIWNGVVSRVHGANAFDIVYSGIITSKTTLTQTPGDLYYLSSTTGGLAVTPVDTDSVYQSPVFMCIDENTLQVFPCAAVSTLAGMSPQNALSYWSGATTFTPPTSGQLTFYIIGGGNGGSGSPAPVFSSGGWLYYGSAGGGGGAMAVLQIDAADITGSVTISAVGAAGAPGSSGNSGSAGGSTTISMTWKGHTLTVTAGGGFPNPSYASYAMPGLGGIVRVTYGGTATPPVIGYPGQAGGPSPFVSGFGTGAISAAYYSSEGLGGNGWMIAGLANPGANPLCAGWGGGGIGADGQTGGSGQAANAGIVAMIS